MEADRRAALSLAHFLAWHGYPLRVPTGKMTPREIWSCSDAALAALLKLSPDSHDRVAIFRRSFSLTSAAAELKRLDIGMISLGEQRYPHCLSQIHDPPAAIFLRGAAGAASQSARLDAFMERPRIAIVGARRASSYGRDAATTLAAELSRLGICVISGLAAGIDSAAHRGALPHRGGTIAVFGSSPDLVYPVSNRRLAAELIESGLIVSEYPPGTEPRPWRFPARNRIISGLSDGVIVVEAKEKSGALITADFALEQGREVFAVPGDIFAALSCGPNALLRSGARPVTGVMDILEDLGLEQQGVLALEGDGDAAGLKATGAAEDSPRPADPPTAGGLSPNEQAVYRACGSRPRHQDELARCTGLSGADTAAALVLLEIGGLVRSEAGMGFRRVPQAARRQPHSRRSPA